MWIWKNIYSTREKAKTTKQIKTSIIKIEHHKISNLLNDWTISEFVIRKWIELNDFSNDQYLINKNMLWSRMWIMLRSDLCDCSDPYIIVKGTVDLSVVAVAK